MNNAESNDYVGPSASDFFYFFKKKYWILICTVLIAGGTSFFAIKMLSPVFLAELIAKPVSQNGGGNNTSALLEKIGGLTGMSSLGDQSTGGITDILAVLNSRSFAKVMVDEYQMKSFFFAEDWDEINHKWKKNEPSMWQAYKVYTSVFTFEYDKKNSLFKIRVEWHDPVIAAKWANQIAMRVNRHFKDQRLAYAEKSIAFLKNQLEQANLVEMREVLFNLIENQTRTVMLAHASDESVLNIIDAAVVPEEKIRPNNSAIFLMSLFLGVSLGLLIIIIMYYRHIIIRNSTG